MSVAATGAGGERDFDGLIVDLDGVVWLGDETVPGSVEALASLRELGVRLLFLTNDPQRSRVEYAEALEAIGVPATASDVVSAGSALAAFAAVHEATGAPAYVIGSPSLKREVAAAGFALVEGDAGRHAAFVAVGAHAGFNYRELRVATQALRGGARLYAAGRDSTFPMPDGPWPGTGAVVAAVETAGRAQATVVGKPEPYIFAIARSQLGGCRSVAIVGDNLDADIAGGRDAGLATVLVLTGTATAEDVRAAEVKPDLTFADLAAVSAFACSLAR